MKINMPVTGLEVVMTDKQSIISMTDLKGQITYVNKDFTDISGYTDEELTGQSHNIVRHPDMPPAAFKDLWDTLKSGRAWKGVVKNRCKNGDHYWVDAFVTPVTSKGAVIGYQSVRSRPTADQVRKAEMLYQQVNQKKLAELPSRHEFRLHLSTEFLVIQAGWLLLLGVALGAGNLDTGLLYGLGLAAVMVAVAG